MSVANLDLSRGISNILSPRYLLAMGKITDLVPCCVVARRVAFARSGPIPKFSARVSVIIFACRSFDTKGRLEGKSSVFRGLFCGETTHPDLVHYMSTVG